MSLLATSRFEERDPMIKNFNAQFSHPQRWLGRLVGMIMALKNRERNSWIISLLDLQPNNQIRNLGIGPSQAIQWVAKLILNSFVAGKDLSVTTVRQASRRNL